MSNKVNFKDIFSGGYDYDDTPYDRFTVWLGLRHRTRYDGSYEYHDTILYGLFLIFAILLIGGVSLWITYSLIGF